MIDRLSKKLQDLRTPMPRPLVILGTRESMPGGSHAFTTGGEYHSDDEGEGGGGGGGAGRVRGRTRWGTGRSGGLLWGGRGRGWSGWEGEGGDYVQSARHRQPVSEVYGVRYADLRRRFRIQIITCTGNYFWFST